MLGFGLGYSSASAHDFQLRCRRRLDHHKLAENRRFSGQSAGNRARAGEFLSLYAAVQTDVWRNLFTGAPILSLTGSHTADIAFFPDRFGRTLNTVGIFALYF